MALVDELHGVRTKIIACEFHYRHSAVVVKTKRALVGMFLLRQLQIQHAAEIERIGKTCP